RSRWDLVESPSRSRFSFEHDLRANAWRLSRGPLHTSPDHAPSKRRPARSAFACCDEISGEPERSSARIVHVEFDRVRRHLEALDLGHLQLDMAVDEIVIEHATRLQEGAVLVKIFQCLAQA